MAGGSLDSSQVSLLQPQFAGKGGPWFILSKWILGSQLSKATPLIKIDQKVDFLSIFVV